jgi:hypothetical protein
MSFPSSEQTETMRIALDLACDELGLREADEVRRARVTSAIATLAEAGQEDAGQLKDYAVYCYRVGSV